MANLSLVAGLALWNFGHSLSARYPWYDGVCGFFFGVSIAINLLVVRKARRCGWQ